MHLRRCHCNGHSVHGTSLMLLLRTASSMKGLMQALGPEQQQTDFCSFLSVKLLQLLMIHIAFDHSWSNTFLNAYSIRLLWSASYIHEHSIYFAVSRFCCVAFIHHTVKNKHQERCLEKKHVWVKQCTEYSTQVKSIMFPM